MLSGNPLTTLIPGTGEASRLGVIDSAYIRPIFGPNNDKPSTRPSSGGRLSELSLDQSIAQGVTLLNNGINAELQNGHDVVVSATRKAPAVATMKYALCGRYRRAKPQIQTGWLSR